MYYGASAGLGAAYGPGATAPDPQIAAQNAATAQIGAIGSEYSSVKSAGNLSASYAQNAIARIQAVIDSYSRQWGGTSRGAAGAKTLQDFVNASIFPTMKSDLASMGAVALPPQQVVLPAQVYAAPETGGFSSTVSTIARTVAAVAGDVAQAAQPYPYYPGGQPLVQASATFPDWFLPAAVVGGLFLLMRRK